MTIKYASKQFEREVKSPYEGGRSRQNAIRCQDDGYRYLAVKIIEKSKTDLLGDDPLEAVDALAWWLDGDAADLAECLGIYKTPDEVWSWIAGGCENDE